MEVSYFHGGTIPLRGCGPRLGGLVVVMAPSSVKPLLCPQADGFSQRTETSNLWSQRLQGREAQILQAGHWRDGEKVQFYLYCGVSGPGVLATGDVALCVHLWLSVSTTL